LGTWRFFCDDHRLQPIAWVVSLFALVASAASIQSAWFPQLFWKAQRSHIHIEGVEPFPLTASGPVKANVHLTNDGQEAASVHGYYDMAVYPIWSKVEEEDVLEDRAFSRFLSRRSAIKNDLAGPSVPAGTHLFVTNGWAEDSEMREQVSELLTGRGILCVVGRFEYTDARNVSQKRRSDYCSWVKNDGVVILCRKHNDEP